MGSFSIVHWGIVLAIPVIVIVIIAKLATSASRRNSADARPVASRLAELDDLRARGVIDAAEADAQRARILRDL
ncbi:SHOCT domain-containing protein [Chiayiivirga flava]|uniref:Cytochrome c-type biogenesis protein CcmH/NrfG n=1 Tax=Chiayiivirga flava TaxID=659595 RepID=A0A7W8D525_9GAMM|nr:SHOCT domain-containing protein [Chiayiivirga flava]MBB5207687.1 cytochrome c-type biogenesis protein CcmH/NrfG [Chiayiivirga flava]